MQGNSTCTDNWLNSSVQGESAIPSHEANMSELSIEYAAALEREKELGKRYDDLFNFLQSHVKESQVKN